MNIIPSKKRLSIILISVLSLLLIPFIGSQVSNVVDWSLSDYVIMGILLFFMAFLVDVVIRTVPSKGRKALFIGLIVILFLLLWAEMAVGIFGSPIAGS